MFPGICGLLIMKETEIRTYLEKILKSKSFALSGVYKNLLEYLTEATLKGEKPKEFTIGNEVFGQDVNDSGTSRVRVSVYKLRKRLDKYYKEEGAHDRIRFVIPKGGYSLEFKANTDFNKRGVNLNLLIIFFVFFLLGGISLIYYFKRESDYKKLRKTEFWNEFINNKKETVVVAGDFFMFQDLRYEREHGRFVNIRDIRINSEQQLLEYLDSDSTLNRDDFVVLTSATYMPRDALYSMQYIFPLLYENKIDYQITLSSDFTWKTYKNYNIIYIGAFKNLKALSILTDKLKIKYNNLEYSISFEVGGKAEKYSSFYNDGKNIDYTVVAKLPGASDNVIYLFVSDNDIGCIAAAKRFTQLDYVRNFEKNIMKDADYFSCIYKAEGIERTGVTFDLLEFTPLKDSTLTNFWHY